jgi:hypothetical protein
MRGSTVRAAASTFRGHQIPMIFKKPYAILIALASVLQAADPPDTLTTANGEKLIGHLVRSKGGSVTFHSDTLGDVTIDWAKVKELSSSRKFAVIPKNVMLKYKAKDEDGIVHGTVSMADQKIEVTPAPGQPAKEIATKDTGNIIDQAAFEGALNRGGNFFKYWTGTITGGASLVEATQDSDTFTGTVHLIRTMPLEDWLNPSNRTSVNFSASYGKIDQPNTPTVKTEILHFDVERDEYFEARVYGFGVASFDHNFSQGLDLQQTYGGGIGWTAVKSANQTLDLKASANYQSQHFETAASNKNLIGSAFAEIYVRKLPLGIVFNEGLTVTPAWNNTSAYSASGTAGITMPVYKRLSLAINTTDTFLNDPPPTFKKNSFQFTTGVTYSLR